jgi:predicted Holliday junction resolvase-like endonuclease
MTPPLPMLEYATAILLLICSWLGYQLWLLKGKPAEIEIREVVLEVENTDRLLEMTQTLGQERQELQHTKDTVVELSHQVAQLQTELESTVQEAKKQKGRAASAHTSKGQILEKWAPFVDHPEIDPDWEPENWSFMGNPIDYIVWDYRQDRETNLEEGMIYIMDVKSAKAQLSTKQRRIRDLVKAGRVEWREIRLD